MDCLWAVRSAHVRMMWHRYRKLLQSAARLVVQVGCHLIGTCNPQTKGKGVSLLSASPALSRFFTCEDCALHCSTTFHCFIRVDGLFGPLPLVACQVLAAILALKCMRQSTSGCQGPRSKVHVACRGFHLKAPSSTVGRTCQRYLLPCRRSGHCAPNCICCEFVNDTQHVSPAIVPASLVA